jgi:major membrane immunogen (membrane-anchored lipoprotein)
MKKLLVVLMVVFLFFGVASAMSDEKIGEMISGETYAGYFYTLDFWKHGQKGFVDVITHGDIRLINTISYEIHNGVVLIEGNVASYSKETGTTVERIYHMLIISHDGRLYPILRGNLVFEKR